MGTMMECQVERAFQNLEQCHEIQGQFTSKNIYPIRYPCYIDEISLNNNNNIETEKKLCNMIQIILCKHFKIVMVL